MEINNDLTARGVETVKQAAAKKPQVHVRSALEIEVSKKQGKENLFSGMF